MSFGKYFNERNYSDLKNRIKILEKKFKELEARTNSQTEVLNMPVVNDNKVAFCTSALHDFDRCPWIKQRDNCKSCRDYSVQNDL